jgi:hypothetical protein
MRPAKERSRYMIAGLLIQEIKAVGLWKAFDDFQEVSVRFFFRGDTYYLLEYIVGLRLEPADLHMEVGEEYDILQVASDFQLSVCRRLDSQSGQVGFISHLQLLIAAKRRQNRAIPERLSRADQSSGQQQIQ